MGVLSGTGSNETGPNRCGDDRLSTVDLAKVPMLPLAPSLLLCLFASDFWASVFMSMNMNMTFCTVRFQTNRFILPRFEVVALQISPVGIFFA